MKQLLSPLQRSLRTLCASVLVLSLLCLSAPLSVVSAQQGAEGVSAKIDLNTAPVTLLKTLYRIGPKLAARIVADREQNGRFNSVEELRRVRGIGARILEKNRDRLMVTALPTSPTP
ncbi:MAG: helix-hairpin-helix domain-containing protein [Myxococcota bacterium]|nr:helix-hairpin-helix domain-containing protein [Myxococcota bacterium]